jgi:hypothetical protein
MVPSVEGGFRFGTQSDPHVTFRRTGRERRKRRKRDIARDDEIGEAVQHF